MRRRLRRGASQLLLEFDLIAQAYPVFANLRNLGLQRRAAVVDGLGVEGGKTKTPPLIEAKGIDVVVRRDEK